MKATLLDVFGNPFIGISVTTNDKYTLIPDGLSEEKLKTIRNTLKTELVEINYDKIGLFSVFTNKFLLLSDIVPDSIIKSISNLNVDIFVVESDLNVISNTMFFYKDKVLILNKYSNELMKQMEHDLDVDVIPINTRCGVFAEYINILNDTVITSPVLPENDLKLIMNLLEIENFEIVTVNSGSMLLNSGLVKNNNGIILGKRTTPVEYSRFLNLL